MFYITELQLLLLTLLSPKITDWQSMFVLYLFALFNLGFMYCSTELQEMTSTVTLDMGFNFKEISTLPTDFCPWQVSFLQPWNTITQLIAMSCSGCCFSNKLRLWGNWIYWHTIWVLWKILVFYPENRRMKSDIAIQWNEKKKREWITFNIR